MFRGLEHTAIASPDPQRLAEWYVQKLDFRINHSYDGNYFVRAADGSMLEIIPVRGKPRAAGHEGSRDSPPGRTVDDFDAAAEELRKRGVEFLTGNLLMGPNRLIFFSDGDGNILHLIKRPQPLP